MAKNFDEIWKRTEAKLLAFKENMPKEIGKDAQRFFVQSFSNQGFTDESFKPWKRREDLDSRRGKKFSTEKVNFFIKKKTRNTVRSVRRRAILVKTGKLRSDVARSMKSATWDRISFEVESDYAIYHNEGAKTKNGGELPRRQFMGNSAMLNKRVLDLLNKKLEKVLTV